MMSALVVKYDKKDLQIASYVIHRGDDHPAPSQNAG